MNVPKVPYFNVITCKLQTSMSFKACSNYTCKIQLAEKKNGFKLYFTKRKLTSPRSYPLCLSLMSMVLPVSFLFVFVPVILPLLKGPARIETSGPQFFGYLHFDHFSQ
jgi:hypothetical protein